MTPQTGAYASYASQTSNFCKIESLLNFFACYEKVIDKTRQLNELGELPNSILTDDIVGIGADSESPIIVQKMVSNQVVWHNTCRNSIDTKSTESQEARWTRGGY